MTLLAFIIAISISGYIGYRFSVIESKLKALGERWEEKRKPTQVSTVIDPFDVVQQVRLEHEKRHKELNP